MGLILKWQFNRPGTWVYPSIRVTATDGDVIESDYAIDAFWTQVDDATPATIDPPAPILPPFSETPDGALLVYSREANNFVPTSVSPFDELGRVNESGLPERLSPESLDTLYTRKSDIDGLIDARFTGRTITVSDEPYGAKGDGVTDDTAAFAAVDAAVSSGSALVSHTVVIPPGNYSVSVLPNFSSNTAIRAERGTVTIKLTGSPILRMTDLNNRTNVRFEGITFDFNGLCTSVGIRCGLNSNRTVFERCTFMSSAPMPAGVMALDLTSGATNGRVIDCDFVNLLNPLRVNGDVRNQSIELSRFTGFGNRGIYAVSTATVGSRDLTIRGNTLKNAANFRTVTNKSLTSNLATLTISGDDNPYLPGMVFNAQGVGAPFDGTARVVTGVGGVGGMDVKFALNDVDVVSTPVTKTGNIPPAIVQDGDPRQPIAILNLGGLHEGLKVIDNTVIGNDGIPHHLTLTGDPESGTLLGGTADCISVHGGSGFVVARNVIRGSGEVGITIGNLARAGLVTENVVTGSNTNGVAMQAVTDIDCVGNMLKNNGRELGAPVAPRVGAFTAIWAKDVTGGTIVNNRCIDDQVTPSQVNVIYTAGANSDIELGHNPRRGGTTRLFTSTAVRTGIRFNLPDTYATATADETRTDATFAPHTHGLSFTGLEAGGVYKFDARLIYAATQAADISFKFTGPTGTTLAWFGDGALSNTTSVVAASASSRQILSITAGPTFGGAGSGVIGNDVYADIRDARLTIGSTPGDFVLTWAQGQSPSVPDATNLSTLRAGSWMRLKRIG